MIPTHVLFGEKLFISNGKAIANLFDVIRRKCLYPIFRGFFCVGRRTDRRNQAKHTLGAVSGTG
jgi:hypothetical protein